jgi:hypothetical protein
MKHYKTKIGRPDALAQMAALGQKRMNTWCAQNICFKSSSRRSNRTITGAIALAVYSVRCKLIWISFPVSGSPKNRSAPLISAGARKSVEIARPKPSSCSFAKASCDPVAERGLRRWLIIWLPRLVYLRHLRHRDFGQRRGRRRQRIEQRIESGGYNELRRGDISSGKQFNGHTATDQYSLHCWSPFG